MEDNNPNELGPGNYKESIFTEEDFSMQGYDKHIRQARNSIYVAAGILTLNVIILYFTLPAAYEYFWIDLSVYGFFIACFIALGWWTKKRPYYAIIGALIMYGLLIAMNAYIDITSIYKGILFKIIIITYLVKGINDAKEAQEMQDQIQK